MSDANFLFLLLSLYSNILPLLPCEVFRKEIQVIIAGILVPGNLLYMYGVVLSMLLYSAWKVD